MLLLVTVTITAAYASSFMKNEVYITALGKICSIYYICFLFFLLLKMLIQFQMYNDELLMVYFISILLINAERKQAINEAIKEAMDEVIDNSMATFKSTKFSKINQRPQKSNQNFTSFQLLRFFKKPSEDAKRMGKANQMYRNIVKKAETKMFEVKRAKVAKSQGAEARAESLAEMLLHRPGSMLTSQEVVRAWQVARNTYYEEEQALNCDFSSPFRTISGICNNPVKPYLGSSGTALRRLLPPFYEDNISTLRGTIQQQGLLAVSPSNPFSKPDPSVRFVSEQVVSSSNRDEVPFTHLIMQFGQFLDHDLGLSPEEPEERGHECTGCTFTDVCQPIKVREADKSFGIGTRNNCKCLLFRRSLSLFCPKQPMKLTPLEQVNDITSFIDGSMIYGSRDDTAKALRSSDGGGLLLEGTAYPMNKPTLPLDRNGKMACPPNTNCFLCGDIRCNEQISLTIMHTLWLREHNRCARKMTTINRHWNDEMLYQMCRKIVGALIQKITYEDYLPKIMGKSIGRFIGKYTGYNSMTDPSIPNSFSTAAYRYGHSLIRPVFDRLNENYKPIPIGPLPLVSAFFSPELFKTSLGTDPIARGWLRVNSRKVDEFLNSVLTTKLFQTKATPGMDLASLNLQRGRDHGLPQYGNFKKFCSKKFGITSDIENMLTRARFIELYGSVDAAEVWLAGLAEKRISDGLLGATFACIFGLTFVGVREGDRFFWENPGVFTNAQKNSIRNDSISRVICENSDNINMIQPDAFLSNQTNNLVSCNQLEGVNFNLFRECSISIKIANRFSKSSHITINTTTDGITTNHNLSLLSGISDHCINVICPTKDTPMTLSFPESRLAILYYRVSLRPYRKIHIKFSLGINLFDKIIGLNTGGSNCGSDKPGFIYVLGKLASETYHAEDVLDEDKSKSYAKDVLIEDNFEPYVDDDLDEDKSKSNSEDVLEEDKSESYSEDVLEEDKSESYSEDVLEEDKSESYSEDVLQEDWLEELLDEDSQEASQEMESENSNAGLESSMEASYDQFGRKEEEKQQKIDKKASLFGELRKVLEKLN